VRVEGSLRQKFVVWWHQRLGHVLRVDSWMDTGDAWTPARVSCEECGRTIFESYDRDRTYTVSI
jgi:hypothetical protein